ncbi:hypothetical protein KV708_19240 [Comamonas thiooxydans]|uniref:hypothetical protein n=1 Tax=Comamonas thiooxydans TaxID=363952 RepID=UPI00070C7F8C|nr:hypothetical protein [Comamonas thiooxydans]
MNLKRMSLGCGVFGFVLLIAGIAMVNMPAALGVAGVLLLGYSLLLDRAAAAMQRLPHLPQAPLHRPASPPPETEKG